MINKFLSKNLTLALIATFLTACTNDMCKSGRAKVKHVTTEETVVEKAAISHEHHKNMVFFAFDSSELTEEGKAVLDQSAVVIKSGNVAKIVVTGHCSEEGSDAYNYGLGERRANVAAKYLLNKHGISSTICSYGKAVDFGHSLEFNRRAMVHVGGDTSSLGAAPCKLKSHKDVVVKKAPKKGLIKRVKDAITGETPASEHAEVHHVAHADKDHEPTFLDSAVA